eukprot:9495981-Pyramimonas_sp.AAC.1
MQLVSAPLVGPFLDTWPPPGAGRSWEDQLRELILRPSLCSPPLPPGPKLGRPPAVRWQRSLLRDPPRCAPPVLRRGPRMPAARPRGEGRAPPL